MMEASLLLRILFILDISSVAATSMKDSCNVSNIHNVLFVPANMDPITEGSTASLQIKLPLELTAKSRISVSSANERVVTVQDLNMTDEVGLPYLDHRTFTGRRKNITDCAGYYFVGEELQTSLKIDVFGVRLGKSDLVITIIPNNSDSTFTPPEGSIVGFKEPLKIPTVYPVVVIRDVGLDDQIFHYGIQFLLAIINFSFGCELDLLIVKSYLKKPLAPSIGFCSQFIFMPLLGVAITQGLSMAPSYSIGLISLACAPGGGASNAWTKLLGGDVNLSLTMTFISLTLALGMMPLWMFIASRIYFGTHHLQIPYLSIFKTLCLFVVPCFLGIILNKFKARFAQHFARVIKPLSVIFLLWVLTFGTYVNLYMWRIMREVPLTIAAGILLPWCGFLFGLCLALAARQGRDRAIAISIETGIQNIGVPIVLLQRSFQQPEGDLAATLANSVGIFTPLPLFVILVILTIRRGCTSHKRENAPENEQEETKDDVECDDSSVKFVVSANEMVVLEEGDETSTSPIVTTRQP